MTDKSTLGFSDTLLLLVSFSPIQLVVYTPLSVMLCISRRRDDFQMTEIPRAMNLTVSF